MAEMYYSHATCRVRPGNEKKFLEAWKQMADEFRALPGPPLEGHLIQSASDPARYYAWGLWHSEHDIEATLTNPRAVDAVNRVRILCSEFDRQICRQVEEVLVEQ
jgi:quinol monooxygenase YgiN